MDISYDFYTGLWKDCFCVSFKGDGVCYCDRKGHTSGSFFAVQVLETLGLIGLTISGIITCLLLFTRQKKALKIINIFIAFCSGAVLAIGVVVYAVNCKNDNDTVFPDIIADLVPHTSELSISFVLCTIAGCLCLLGFTALLLVDLRTASVQSQDIRQQSRPVEFSDQGQSSLAQGKAIIQTYVLPS